jgi:hypothetical protein
MSNDFRGGMKRRNAVLAVLATSAAPLTALAQATRPMKRMVAIKHGLPSVSQQRPYAVAGGLMSYGRDTTETFRRAATYVDISHRAGPRHDEPLRMAPVRQEGRRTNQVGAGVVEVAGQARTSGRLEAVIDVHLLIRS